MSKKNEIVFSVEQLAKSKTFGKYQDLLYALLSEDRNYSIMETQNKINNFLERKVN